MGRLDKIYQLDLPHRAIAVYCYLYERANKEGECWPAVPTIAQEIKLSDATVRRAIRDLKKAGVIETEQRYRTKGGKNIMTEEIVYFLITKSVAIDFIPVV